MDKIAERLRMAMNLRKMRQVDIIRVTGINKGSLSSYLSGKYQPKQTNIYLLAQVLNVNEGWLMGHDVPMERQCIESSQNVPFVENPEYGTEEENLLRYYHSVNQGGQREAVKRIYELSCITTYNVKSIKQ